MSVPDRLSPWPAIRIRTRLARGGPPLVAAREKRTSHAGPFSRGTRARMNGLGWVGEYSEEALRSALRVVDAGLRAARSS